MIIFKKNINKVHLFTKKVRPSDKTPIFTNLNMHHCLCNSIQVVA
jgi:hypothetical protein